MKEKKQNAPKIILILALVAIGIFAAVIIVRLVSTGTREESEGFVGQWTDTAHDNASLDIWDTDEGTFVGMSSWQIDFSSAAFLDFDAEAVPGGLKITNCTRTDVIYDDEGDGVETVVYENGTGMIRKGEEGTLLLTIDGDPEPSEYVFALEGEY